MTMDTEVTIWTLPHKAYGRVVAIDFDSEEDEKHDLYAQNRESRTLHGAPLHQS